MTFVEVLDRRGRVVARVQAARLPFRIGRGYDCDLILDDPHVDAVHAVLEHDDAGRLHLRDAGSRNGMACEGSRDPVARVDLDGDVSVRLGRTLLRLRGPGFRVPEAVPIVRRSRLAEWLFDHWSAAIVVPLVCLAVQVFRDYQKTTTPFEPLVELSETGWLLLADGFWSRPWALLNRLLRQRTRWVAHSTIAFVFATVQTLASWGMEWLRFVVAAIEPLQLLDLFVTTALLGATLFAHLTVMGVASRRLRFGIVGVGFGAVLGLQLIDHFDQDTGWVTTLPYWSRLQPLDPRWLPVESPDAFFAHLPEIGERLEELAEAAKEEDDDAS
ncbi:MAG: FHA domain-containing protein [Myxococcota bacterium]